MSKGNGPLDFEATLDATKLNQMLEQMERRIKGTTEAAIKEADKMDKAFNRVGMMVGGYFTATFGAKLIGDIVSVRGEFQQLEIAFETILKNKAKSDKLMQEITQFAAKTPFDLKQVASGAKQLLAYGESADEVIGTMRKLGDVASGLSIPFGDLIYLYGTSRTQGKLMTKDLMQFAGRGVPIIEELSKVLNVSKSRVLEMASESKIGFEHLQQVIDNLTKSTGMFGGMMQKQAASLPGLISNLGDAWDRMFNDFGKQTEELTAGAIKLATSFVENYENFLKVLKIIILTYGTYKAAVIAQTIAMNGYGKALGFVIAKEKILAILSKRNPWGLIIAGATAVISTLIAFNKETEKTISLQDELAQKADQRYDSEKKALDSLFGTLQRTNSSEKERSAAIGEINSRYGSYLKNLLTEKSSANQIAEAYDNINESLRDNIEITLRREKVLELGRKRDKAAEEYNRIKSMSGSDYAKEVGKIEGIRGAVRKEALARLADEWATANNQFNNLTNEIQSLLDGKSKKVESSIIPSAQKIKTFEENLEEIKKKYQDYYKWQEHYGKESADNQFKELIKSGDSYLRYLNSQITSLEGKKRSPEESNNLVTLLASKDELLGVKTGLQVLQEQTEKSKGSFSSLVDYISFLNDELNKLQSDGSELTYQKVTFLQGEIESAKAEFVKTSTDTYNSLLEQATDYKLKREVIERDFQQTIKKLDKESLGEKYDQAVKVAEEIRDSNLKALKVEEIQKLEAYRQLAENIEKLNRHQIKNYIIELEKASKVLGKQEDYYKSIAAQIDQANQALKQRTVKTFDTMSQGFAGLADMASSLDSSLHEAFDLASNLANSISQFASGNYAGGIISGASTIFKYISETGKRHDAEYEQAKQESLEKTKEFIDKLNKSLEQQIELIDELTGVDKIAAYGNAFNEVGKNIEAVIDRLKEFQVVYESSGSSGNGRGGSRSRHYSGPLELSDIDLNLKDLSNIEKIEKITEAIETAEDDLLSIRKLISEGRIKDSEELQAQLEAYEQYTDELKDLQNKFFAEVTGTTYESILDSFVSAFEQGLTSAEYFANSFEDMMRKALLQALSINALQTPLNEWYQAFAETSSDGLSKAEVAKLKEELKVIYSNAEDYAEMLEQAAGINFGQDKESQDKLSSAVKGVNQQTASLIAGYMNALRLNQAHSLELMNRKLQMLAKIDTNTLNTANFAKLIYEILQSNSSNNLPKTRING